MQFWAALVASGEWLYYSIMIGKLTGRFGGTTREGAGIVDVGGVGYAVRVPTLHLAALLLGAPLTLYVHTAVREDAIDLYGFPTEDELALFKMLTSVSGVGPKTALGLLNVADARSLSRAVAAGDSTVLTKMYGVGKKIAERIVMELRDKMPESGIESINIGVDAEAMEALEALGYSASEARDAVRKSEGATIHERVAAALRQLGATAK